MSFWKIDLEKKLFPESVMNHFVRQLIDPYRV